MSVGKEELIVLENLAREQVRIYPDACDVGVWETPSVRTRLVMALAGLKDLEGGHAVQGTDWSAYHTRLAYEQDGPAISGVLIRVTRRQPSRLRGRAYYEIEFKRATWAAEAAVAALV